MNSEELKNLREKIRHSTAHVMADVVTQLYPEAKLAIGPPTEDGFYYDFMVETPFSDEDLKKNRSSYEESHIQGFTFHLC